MLCCCSALSLSDFREPVFWLFQNTFNHCSNRYYQNPSPVRKISFFVRCSTPRGTGFQTANRHFQNWLIYRRQHLNVFWNEFLPKHQTSTYQYCGLVFIAPGFLGQFLSTGLHIVCSRKIDCILVCRVYTVELINSLTRINNYYIIQ